MNTIQTANSHSITQEQINAIIQKCFDEATEQAANFEDSEDSEELRRFIIADFKTVEQYEEFLAAEKEYIAAREKTKDPTIILDRLQKEITPDCFYKGQDSDFYFASPRKPDFLRANKFITSTTPDGISHTSLTTAINEVCGPRYLPPIYEEARQLVILDTLRLYAGDDYLEQRLLAFIWSEVSKKPAYLSDLNDVVKICRYFAESEPSVSLPYPLQWLKLWRPETMSEAGRQKLLAIADRFDKLKADIQAAYDLVPDAQTTDFGYTPPNDDDALPF